MSDTTAQELLDVIMGNIAALQDGTRTPAGGNAVTNSVAAALRLAKAQLDYAKANDAKPYIPMLEMSPKPRGRR